MHLHVFEKHQQAKVLTFLQKKIHLSLNDCEMTKGCSYLHGSVGFVVGFVYIH